MAPASRRLLGHSRGFDTGGGGRCGDLRGRLSRRRPRHLRGREPQVDPGLEEIDPRPERRNLAARLTQREEGLAISFSQAAKLGQELSKRAQLGGRLPCPTVAVLAALSQRVGGWCTGT